MQQRFHGLASETVLHAGMRPFFCHAWFQRVAAQSTFFVVKVDDGQRLATLAALATLCVSYHKAVTCSEYVTQF
jgi:hypothetical protein